MGILKNREAKSRSESNRTFTRRVRGEGHKSGTARESNPQSFGEDFNLEHSSLVSSTVAAILAGCSALDSGASRGFAAQDFRSPSCVYVG